MRGYYRHTKIIATLGPSTESQEQIARLIVAGVDVMRLNMAHGTGEWAISLVERIREVSREVERQVAVMMDVKGPEIRTGVLHTPIDLKAGDLFELCTHPRRRGPRSVDVNYPDLPRDVSIGGTILLDSGLIRL